jgi:ABC-type Na+ transport system ATPase subunit NatA
MYLNSGIEISNIKTLFSSLCSRNNKNDNCEFISKIRVYNFFAINEIKNCDIIFVIKNGKILEKGTHDELIAQNGFYTKLNGHFK